MNYNILADIAQNDDEIALEIDEYVSSSVPIFKVRKTQAKNDPNIVGIAYKHFGTSLCTQNQANPPPTDTTTSPATTNTQEPHSNPLHPRNNLDNNTINNQSNIGNGTTNSATAIARRSKCVSKCSCNISLYHKSQRLCHN